MQDNGADQLKPDIQAVTPPDFKMVAAAEYSSIGVRSGVGMIAEQTFQAIRSRMNPHYIGFKERAKADPQHYGPTYARVEGLRFGTEKILEMFGQGALVDKVNRDAYVTTRTGQQPGRTYDAKEYAASAQPIEQEDVLSVAARLGRGLGNMYAQVGELELKERTEGLTHQEAVALWETKGSVEANEQALLDLGFTTVYLRAYEYGDKLYKARHTEDLPPPVLATSSLEEAKPAESQFEKALHDGFTSVDDERTIEDVRLGIAACAVLYGGHLRGSQSSFRAGVEAKYDKNTPPVAKYAINDELAPFYRQILEELGQTALLDRIGGLLGTRADPKDDSAVSFTTMVDFAYGVEAPKLLDAVGSVDTDALRKIAVRLGKEIADIGVPIEDARRSKEKEGYFSSARREFDMLREKNEARRNVLQISFSQWKIAEIAEREGHRRINEKYDSL